MMEFVREYLELGFKVFPLRPKDKKPHPGTGGFRDATDSPLQCEYWWGQEFEPAFPTQIKPRANHNLGIRCGDGYVVLDVDGDEGKRQLREYSAIYGPLPETPVVRTPGKQGEGPGWHYYFKGVMPTRNYSRQLSMRGEGSYVVGAGSIHPSPSDSTKPQYYWAKGKSPKHIPFAELPQWLIDAPTLKEMKAPDAPPPKVEEVLLPRVPVVAAPSVIGQEISFERDPIQYDLSQVQANPDEVRHELMEQLIAEGTNRATYDGRNNAGLWLAQQLRDNGCDKNEARELMLRYQSFVEKAKSPHYTKVEAVQTLRQVFDKQTARDPWPRIEHAEKMVAAGVYAVNGKARTGVAPPAPNIAPPHLAATSPDALEWPEPDPIEQAVTPEFPPDLQLPPWFEEYVYAAKNALEVPVDVPLWYCLGMVGHALQGVYAVQARPGWIEDVNPYICVVSPVGSGKSRAMARLMGPLAGIDREAFREGKKAATVAATNAKTLERQAAAAMKKLEGAQSDGTSPKVVEKVREEAAKLAAEAEGAKMEIPKPRRVFTGDCTDEKLADLLDNEQERLGLLTTEGKLFKVAAGQVYGQTPQFDVLLKAYSADSVVVDRLGRPSIFLRAPLLTIVSAVQPDVMAMIAGQKAFASEGLFSRFWFINAPEQGGERNLLNVQADILPDVENRWWNFLERAHAMVPEIDEKGKRHRRLLKLSPSNLAIINDHMQVADRRAQEEDGGTWQAGWMARYPGHALRLVGILHALSLPNSLDRLELHTVQAETVELSCQLANYLRDHIRSLLGFAGVKNPVREKAVLLLEWLKNRATAEGKYDFSGSEIRKYAPRALREDCMDAAEYLAERSWIKFNTEFVGRAKKRVSAIALTPRTKAVVPF